MKDATNGLTRRIAGRVRELRAAQGLSLEALARRSEVSRSMISLVERGESSPTAVVLDKLAASLGVPMASLFDVPTAMTPVHHGPVARRDDQLQWKDPASGYVRRTVTPPGTRQPMQIVEVLFPPRGRVAFEASRQDSQVYQQVWVLEGEMEITVDEELYRLREGDCLAIQLDCPKMFYNPTRKITRYVVVMSEPLAKR